MFFQSKSLMSKLHATEQQRISPGLYFQVYKNQMTEENPKMKI
jgi:hypothetical protein